MKMIALCFYRTMKGRGMKTRRGMATEKRHFQMEIHMRVNTRMGRDMVTELIDSRTWPNMLENTQIARSMDKVNCLILHQFRFFT